MNKKFRIIIAGIGGVGGYIGGKLAQSFLNPEDPEIIFYVRGENLETIRSQGLTVKTNEGTFIAHPAMATNKAEEAGIADLIICCVKSYHLEKIMEELKPCIGDQTCILPLLNGVNAPDRLQKLFPASEIWTGCIYIVSRLTAPGMIEQKGAVNALHFGAGNGNKEKMEYVQHLFHAAGINSTLHTSIDPVVWQKFVFISAIGSLTSYLNTSIGNILSNAEHKALLLSLLSEITVIAKAKHIVLPPDIIENTLKTLASLPYETTSSMQIDFAAGKQTEAETLTLYVITLGKELNIATPAYELVGRKLLAVS